MSTCKQFRVPSYTRRRIYKQLTLFEEKENGLCAKSCVQLRRKGEFLVCAEGVNRLSGGILPTAKLFRGNLTGQVFVYQNGAIFRFISGNLQQFGQIAAVKDVLEVLSSTNEVRLLIISPNGVYEGFAEGVRRIYDKGGSCFCSHYERVFVVNGNTVRYSAPIAVDDWEFGVHTAGEVVLPSDDGEAIAICSYKEKLFLFRERGITMLRVSGDEFDMKATKIPFSGGNILPHSIANCGRFIYFCTENGLFRLNGAYCTRVGGVFPFVHDETVVACSQQGKFCAAVTRTDGGRALFCYDEEDGGYFIGVRATQVVGGDAVCLNEAGELFEMTDSAVLDASKGCFYQTELSALGLFYGKKRLQSLSIEGYGRIKVRISTEEGDYVYVEGRAGELLSLPRVLSGNAFSLNISTFDKNIRISGAIFNILEENRHGY